MKKSGRAQVTLFVIMALVIIAIIIGFFFFRNNALSQENVIPPEFQPIQDFVQNCLRETSENALIKISEQGGYFFISEDIPSIDGRIPYYLQGNKKLVPTKQEIESNLAGFVKEELGFCILNFKDFKQQYNLSSELKKINTVILDNRVKFILEYPLAISKKGTESTYQLKNFEVEIPVRLGIINRVTEEIISKPFLNDSILCLTCIYDLAKENNLSINFYDYENNSIIYNILDDNSKLNNESYNFVIAVKNE